MIERAKKVTSGLLDFITRVRPGRAIQASPASPSSEVEAVRPPLTSTPADISATSRVADAEPAPTKSGLKSEAIRRLLWQGNPWEAFKTVAILFSFSVNLILVLALIIVGSWLFDLKNAIAHPLVGGLYQGFTEMDNATIIRTIPVTDSIPVSFTLPIAQTTIVTLTQPVVIPVMIQLPILGTTVTGNAPITLPEGTPLQIQLDTEVPVETSIPINLAVDVIIPIRETQLHGPFVRFQTLIRPYYDLLAQLPPTWEDFIYGLIGPLK